jgi:uncharacterized protein (DUF433 family)
VAPATKSRLDVARFSSIEDPREVPAYGIDEAALYLQVPPATLRSWVLGRDYPVKKGRARFQPLIRPASEDGVRLLSFLNLVEAHVLSAIRHEFGVDLAAVRRAIDFLEKRKPSRHPLADRSFETDGQDLFVRELGHLVAVSAGGQKAMRAVLDAHLKRIVRDGRGMALRLFLFTRRGVHAPDAPRIVLVDPGISYGRPVLAGTGIPTAVIAERFKAGETIADLAADYDRSPGDIEEALRCEQFFQRAA